MSAVAEALAATVLYLTAENERLRAELATALTSSQAPKAARSSAAERQARKRERDKASPYHVENVTDAVTPRDAVTIAPIERNLNSHASVTLLRDIVTPDVTQGHAESVTSRDIGGTIGGQDLSSDSKETLSESFLESPSTEEQRAGDIVTPVTPASIPGRSPNWQHWPEAASIAGRLKSGEGDKLQELLHVFGQADYPHMPDALECLARALIASKNPAGLVMHLFGYATDGISWAVLADAVLVSGQTGRHLSKVLTEFTKRDTPNPFKPPEPELRPEVANATSADWRAAMNGTPTTNGVPV